MGGILKHYNKCGNSMMIGYTNIPGKNDVKQLKYLSVKEINHLIDGYVNMRKYQNSINMVLNANLDDLIFILNDELFNRRVKKL